MRLKRSASRRFEFNQSCMTNSIKRVPVIGNNRKTRIAAISKVLENKVNGDWAEFGVFTGGSARLFLEYLPENTRFSLFDSFEGLPEKWDQNHPKGHFACNIPQFDDERIEIVKGWFSDTVVDWVNNRERPLSFIHVDSDIYSSAKTVLMGCDQLIVPGTVVLFDELFGYEGWEYHEYKAYREWLKICGRECKYLGRSSNHRLYLQVIN